MRFNFTLLCLLLLLSCKSKMEVDLIIHNAKIYTVDDDFSIAEAFAVKDGKILTSGSSAEILNSYSTNEIIDVEGKPVYPGFIDPHCHFLGYGKFLQQVNLVGTKSFDEVVKKISEHHQKNNAPWIIGRGWDQNDWEVKEFPTKDTLDKLFPDVPIYVKRIDGHAALVNQRAWENVKVSSQSLVEGGEIVLNEDGSFTGILIDNAMDYVENIIPKLSDQQMTKALLNAQSDCFAVGLTTVSDAGLEKNEVELIDSLQSDGKLQMRIYAMLTMNAENKSHYLQNGKYKTDNLNVCSFKLYADGALGSRGACLIDPYSDKQDHQGFLLSSHEELEETTREIFNSAFQLNTHCIGDSANRIMLNLYGKYLKENNDRRWRIEHAQIVHPDDFELFGKYNVIPSIQTTHGTSDMYWAEERLGPERIKGAYAYQDLLKQNNMIANGSDFPIENINPLYGFYAGVARKDHKSYPENGFQMENCLTREQALKAMTIWAAYANFEEQEKGSIEKGKFADFVILEDDIMKMDESNIPQAKVLSTYINGVKVY